MAELRELISPAPLVRCGQNSYPVLSMTMHDGIMLQSERFKKSLASVDQSTYKVVKRNQLVIGFPIDEGVLYIQKVIDEGIMSPAYDVWDVNQSLIDLNYLELCLHSPQAMDYYKKNLRGTTARRRSLPKDVLLSLPISLPNIDEQIKIARRIEKLSNIIALRKKQLQKLDDLVKARFIEMFGGCKDRKRLAEFSILITKGASPKWQGIDYCDKGTLFVTSENVREGYIDLSKRKYLPDEINRILPRSMLQRNDVLINIVGASIGRAAIFESDELANINQAVAVVRLKKDALDLRFLITFLNSEEAEKAYGVMKKGGARDNLSLQNISDLLIPVATMQEQQHYSAFVSQVDKSKLSIQQSIEKLETLKKSLMQQYFG